MLEEQAKKPTGLKQITLPPGTVKFLTGLMEKYGDNYKVNNLFLIYYQFIIVIVNTLSGFESVFSKECYIEI